MKTDHGVADNRLYLVLAAMRGPDCYIKEFAPFKYHLTARLRAIMFTEEYARGMWNNQPFLETDYQVLLKVKTNIGKQIWEEAYHYRSHLRLPIRLTENHPIWNGYANIIYKYILI